jgi:ribosomal protein S18 acetylase RimI-like enzyme
MVPNRTSGRKQSDSALEPRRTTGGAISRAWRGCMLRHMPCADIALARRIERAECRLSIGTAQAVIARAGDAFVVRFGGGAAVFSGSGSPLNKVIGVGFDGPPSAAEWDTVERAFAAKGCPVRVELSTLSDSGVSADLTRRSYVLAEFENVLGFDLARAEVPGAATVEGLSIGRDEGELTSWMDVVVAGFALPDGSAPSTESFENDTLKRVFRDFATSAGFTRYLARVHGTDAGGAGLRVAEGVAQFCVASTLPAFRRRGVQTALLRRRLLDAQEAGCDVAIVTTQPGSKSNHNAQRQGFELLYPRAVLIKETA